MLPLIAAAWIAIVMIVLAACRTAARSDASSHRAGSEAQGAIGKLVLPGLIVWDCADPDEVSHAATLLAEPAKPSTRRTVTPLRIARHDRRAARLQACPPGTPQRTAQRS